MMSLRGMRPTLVLVFPILQSATFLLAVHFASSLSVLGDALLLASALLLCLAVHVSIHEAVHHPELARFPLAGPLFTVVMGLPFQGYRWHHLNHHRWNNELADYSSTWRTSPTGPRAWPLWSYVLGWPRQLVRSGLSMRAADAAGSVPPVVHRAIRLEQTTLLLLVIGLSVFAPALALRYVAVVYVGWGLIALQNYGQHPPRKYGAETPTSYYGALYNRLLFRNGLHAEHHDVPHLAWYEITADPRGPIRAPHLLQPFIEKGAR
jgi:fatty acid desaturase